MKREPTLNSRNRQARLSGGKVEGGGGGRRAPAMAATIQRLGLPADRFSRVGARRMRRLVTS
eukprot:5178466-Pyramimonas_sp.AAC.1